jgi:carotenoid cleavage dioxygenase
MVDSPYLSGNFAPVSEEVTAFDLPVTGALPPELDGRYLRNGPNPIDPDPATYHWFTGEGMVHGVRLRDGTAEWYRNRWVRNPTVAEHLGEPVPEGPRTDGMDSAPNTNVIGLGGRTIALVEAGTKPVELDEDLGTCGPIDFDGTLPYGYSAHPKVDPTSGELHTASYYWARPGVIDYSVVSTDGVVVRREDVPVPGSPMVHDISITARYAVFYDLPVVFDLESAMSGSRLPYVWSDEYGARVGVLPRDGAGTDGLRWFEVDPCYVFHPMNAHDAVGADGAELVVLDVVRHDRVFDRSRLGPDESVPTLWRWTIDLTHGSIRTEQLHEDTVEFPRVDERLVGRPYRYGWAASVAAHRGDGQGVVFDGASIAKFDLVSGTVTHHEMGPGRAAGEAVFVPSAADAAEDDGYVLTLVYDAAQDRSDLVVLAGQDISAAPVATVHLPRRVPFGFHGNWIPTT